MTYVRPWFSPVVSDQALRDPDAGMGSLLPYQL